MLVNCRYHHVVKYDRIPARPSIPFHRQSYGNQNRSTRASTRYSQNCSACHLTCFPKKATTLQGITYTRSAEFNFTPSANMHSPSALVFFLLALLTATCAAEARSVNRRYQHLLSEPSGPSTPSSSSYAEHNISVPIDHFHNDTRYAPHSDDTFNLRYWFDAKHYRKGGPVVVIAAGETDATARLPFLSQGIVSQLAERYHGVGVILEHRYYGKSFPVGDLTAESIRFLSTEQALADYAYFASNVQFPGLEHLDLTAGQAPWIAYGGSYAGAFVSFLRKLYPDVYWGAVSSSGVTQAIVDYWEYMEPIRQFAPSSCISATETFTDIVDKILIDHGSNETLGHQLQSAFGVKSPMKKADFANVLSSPLSLFQNRNWDPQIGSPGFQQFCANITSSDLLYPNTAAAVDSVKKLIRVAGYDATNTTLVNGVLNYAGYSNATSLPQAQASEEEEDGKNSPRSLSRSSSTSWNYQVCTEWGFFATGASVPAHIPPLISRLIDLKYTSAACSEDFGITTPPDVSIINKHGGHNFSYPRVAIIDGMADPWRPATPHADAAPKRESTDEEPFILVDVPATDVWDGMRGAVHHWDQNGLSGKELDKGEKPPGAISNVHQEVVRFVGVWLEGWKRNTALSQRNAEL